MGLPAQVVARFLDPLSLGVLSLTSKRLRHICSSLPEELSLPPASLSPGLLERRVQLFPNVHRIVLHHNTGLHPAVWKRVFVELRKARASSLQILDACSWQTPLDLGTCEQLQGCLKELDLVMQVGTSNRVPTTTVL